MQENEKNPGDEKLLILPLGEESKKITQVITNDTARQMIDLLADAPLSASDIAERLKVPLTTVAYNLENLEDVGLVKIERIKYSEKGREVKIYAPVRKLIVVVPEKTDRKSVGDVIRKYLGVILAAVLASSLIEFLTRKAKVMQTTVSNLMPVPAPLPTNVPAVTSTPAVNETIKGSGTITGTIATPVATQFPPVGIPAVNSTLIAPAPTSTSAYEWSANATPTAVPVQTPIPETAAASQAAAPDVFTNLANAVTAHPGLIFLMGCLFMVALLIIVDYRRKRKNG